jgi:hypothetical protein
MAMSWGNFNPEDFYGEPDLRVLSIQLPPGCTEVSGGWTGQAAPIKECAAEHACHPPAPPTPSKSSLVFLDSTARRREF